MPPAIVARRLQCVLRSGWAARDLEGLRCALSLCALMIAIGAALPARAQLGGHITLSTDYRYRGESLTEGRPALQAGIDYQHASGAFLGALGSTIRVDSEVSGVGGQLYGGYARALSAALSWELGAVAYLFPSPRTEPRYTYAELFIGLTFERISTRVFYADH